MVGSCGGMDCSPYLLLASSRKAETLLLTASSKNRFAILEWRLDLNSKATEKSTVQLLASSFLPGLNLHRFIR